MNLIPLAPVDYIFTGPGSQPITFAFEFPGKIGWQFLEQSLAEVIKIFPAVSSTLVKIDINTYAFEPSKEGREFIEVQKDISFTENTILNEYITPVQTIPGKPLMRIQVTQTNENTILGLSISHALTDGFSYFHFLSSWARMTRDQKFLPPVMQRNLVRGDPKSVDLPFKSDQFIKDTGLFTGPPRKDNDPGELQIDRFNISQDEIGNLLKDIHPPEGVKITYNDVLSAYLWKKYAMKWFTEGEIYISCPFDFRGILSEVPRTYFGCAILCASTSMDFNQLKQSRIGDLALKIRQAVNNMNPGKISSGLNALETLRHADGIPSMEKIHVRHPSHGMIVTNLSRMPIQDVDFGTGPPSHFIAHSDIDHGAAILPAKDGVEVLVYK